VEELLISMQSVPPPNLGLLLIGFLQSFGREIDFSHVRLVLKVLHIAVHCASVEMGDLSSHVSEDFLSASYVPFGWEDYREEMGPVGFWGLGFTTHTVNCASVEMGGSNSLCV
jgi:hypothetical protein